MSRKLGLVLAIFIFILGVLYMYFEDERKFLLWALFFFPEKPFLLEEKPDLIDYTELDYWAAHPEKKDSSDFVPDKTFSTSKETKVNVFYIHPTTYLSGESWIYDVKFQGPAYQNIQWFLRNQASIFNRCCEVYAPYYSQSSIFTYIANFFSLEEAEIILDYSYKDVERAFKHFIENFNNGAHFIVASHSQGSHHAHRLIKEVIDPEPDIASKLVVAYALGSAIIRDWSEDYFSQLVNVERCTEALQVSCVVHWDTVSAKSLPWLKYLKWGRDSLCTNPIGWKINGGRSKKSAHVGSLVAFGELFYPEENDPKFIKVRQESSNVRVVIKKKFVTAYCKDGFLAVSAIGRIVNPHSKLVKYGNYHLLDYSLFYFDIQKNLFDRIKTLQEKY